MRRQLERDLTSVRQGHLELGAFLFFRQKISQQVKGGCLPQMIKNSQIGAEHLFLTALARQRLPGKIKTILGKGLLIMQAIITGCQIRYAALGNNQLMRLKDFNFKRQRIAQFYDSELKKLDGLVEIPKVALGAEHVYQTYTITVQKKIRNSVVKFLNECNVGASVHFDPPVHLQPFYKNLLDYRCMLPSTEKLSAEVISLPIYPDMTLKDQKIVVKQSKSSLTVDFFL